MKRIVMIALLLSGCAEDTAYIREQAATLSTSKEICYTVGYYASYGSKMNGNYCLKRMP